MKKNITLIILLQIVILNNFLVGQWAQDTVCRVYPYSGISGFTANDNYIFASSYANGIYRSSDDGINWTEINSGIYTPHFMALTSRQDTIFAAGGGSSSRFYISTNNGSNWLMRGLTGWNQSSILLDSNNIYVTTQYALYKSTDFGMNWNPLIFANTNVVEKHDNFIFLGSSAKGLIISSDYGITWDTLDHSSTAFVVGLLYHSNKIFAAINNVGFASSTDNGLNWTPLNEGLSNLNITKLFRIDNTFFICTYGGGIFISNDQGNHWTQHNEGMTNTNIYSMGYKAPYVYAGTDSGMIYFRPFDQLVSVKNDYQLLPIQYMLEQNYPNPFNPSTNIQYAIGSRQFVQLKVYDVLGNEIATLVNEEKPAGTYEVMFNPESSIRYPASGIYFYQLKAGDYLETKKMILMK